MWRAPSRVTKINKYLRKIPEKKGTYMLDNMGENLFL